MNDKLTAENELLKGIAATEQGGEIVSRTDILEKSG